MVPLLLVLLAACLPGGSAVFITNDGPPRRDVTGALMDVHDGNVVQWQPGGDFFWYGMGYGGCLIDQTAVQCAGVLTPLDQRPCGFQLNHSINVYSSPDLVNWTYRGDALPMSFTRNGSTVERPVGIYFRPKVLFHPTRQRYILWVNHLPVPSLSNSATSDYPFAGYVVAESDTPVGPFTVVTLNASTAHPGGGDFDILVDGTDAYLLYNSFHTDHQMSVERLTADFTDSTGQGSGLFGPVKVEAPTFYKYQGVYYAMFGVTCCFCYTGSGVQVFTAQSPIGPWTYSGRDIGLALQTTNNASFSRSQQSHVFFYKLAGNSVPVWAGDQWGISADGTKGHIYQYWVPMAFDAGTPPLPQPLQMVTGFDTNAPFNLSAFATGFCDLSDVPIIDLLKKCGGGPECQALSQQAIANFTQPCRQCFIANAQTPATLLQKCMPPEYRPPRNLTCAPADVPIILTLTSCGSSPACQQEAVQLLAKLTPDCAQCLLGNFQKQEPIEVIQPICLPFLQLTSPNSSTAAEASPAPSTSPRPSRSPVPSASPPSNCAVVKEWGQWGRCSARCGGGMRVRQGLYSDDKRRHGDDHQGDGHWHGPRCPPARQTQACNTAPCGGWKWKTHRHEAASGTTGGWKWKPHRREAASGTTAPLDAVSHGTGGSQGLAAAFGVAAVVAIAFGGVAIARNYLMPTRKRSVVPLAAL